MPPSWWRTIPGSFERGGAWAPFRFLVLRPGGKLVAIDCYEEFWKPPGRAYVFGQAWRGMGSLRFLALLPRLVYFLTPNRMAHVREDIRRLKREGRYTWDEVVQFYARHLAGLDRGQDRMRRPRQLDETRGFDESLSGGPERPLPVTLAAGPAQRGETK